MIAVKIVVILALLMGMVMVLMGIGHLYRKDGSREVREADRLRRDIKESDNVITRNSIFHDFLVRKPR